MSLISFLQTLHQPFHLRYYGFLLAGEDQQHTDEPNDEAGSSPKTSGFQTLPIFCYAHFQVWFELQAF